MAKVVVTVCDRCDTQEGVESFEIKRGDQKTKVDLCPEHSKPLTEVLAYGNPQGTPGRKPAAKKAATSGRGRKQTVTTLDQIEAAKKK